ncbi:uncharacterized protein EI90DRAFT_3076176, partial [Cantharellus anzutake]|uniref:uncharacterized protein n=1 Tax=Cantharellus anzutake TaxID=1750568 RepID=UPI00190707A6
QGLPEALSFSYLKNYGRPYWSTYAATNFLSATRRKLYKCSRSLYLNPIDIDHRDIVGCSHIETVTPSEPALAETYKRTLETFFDNLMINGSILKRSRQAELFGCILLTLARDWASAFKSIQQVPTISSKVFLTTLLGENFGFPPNDQSLQFLNEMDNAHINFTHIVQRTEDVDNLSFDFLCKAWCRGAAFRCKSQQPCIAEFIVTQSGALDDPFELKWFNYIAWRSELRVDASTSGLPSELARPRIEGQRPQSTVVSFMDLGTNCGFGSTTGKLCQLTLGPAQHPHVPSHGWGDEEPPRWCIYARGHTFATYPAIEWVSLQFTALFNQSSSWMDRALSEKGEENPFVVQLDLRKGLAVTPGSEVK